MRTILDMALDAFPLRAMRCICTHRHRAGHAMGGPHPCPPPPRAPAATARHGCLLRPPPLRATAGRGGTATARGTVHTPDTAALCHVCRGRLRWRAAQEGPAPVCTARNPASRAASQSCTGPTRDARDPSLGVATACPGRRLCVSGHREGGKDHGRGQCQHGWVGGKGGGGVIKKKKVLVLLGLCVSSLRRGHAKSENPPILARRIIAEEK